MRLSDHFGIHIIQLPYRKPLHAEMDDKERWIYFLKEGENMDINNFPEELETPEIRQAMRVLERFSDNKEEYFLYQKRLESIRIEKTWQEAIERKEIELREKDSQLKQKDSQLEQVQEEKERLLELLRKAGIEF
jgi:hypothetical protein